MASISGDSPVAVAYQHVREPAAPPSDHDTDLPPEIDAIVMKALAKRLEDRYQSAAAMRSDIERYLAGRPVHAVIPAAPATTMIPPVDPTSDTTAVRPAVPPTDEDDRGSRTGVLVALGILIALLLAAAAFFVLPRMFDNPVQQTQVPNLIGLTEKEARAAVGDAGLSVGTVDFQSDPRVPKDKVISQDPNRDQYVAPGSSIDFVVSTGQPLVTVPSVVGQDKAAAQAALQNAHLKVVLRQAKSDEPPGQVLSTDPAGGQSVPRGTTVTVTYALGPEQVPAVVGMQQAEAEKAIRDAGFQPDVVESSNTTEPKGTVIQQSPKAGQTADQGSTVTILVSSYEPPTTSPSPTPSPTTSPTLPTPSSSSSPRGVPPGQFSPR